MSGDKDKFGFPVGTRWVAVTAFDANGKRLGHAIADVLNTGTTAQAQSNCMGSLVQRFGQAIAKTEIAWGE